MIHMADCASIATERSLPYAFLVMDLIVSADIHIAGPSTKMTKIWIIQDSTFWKKSGDGTGAGPSRAPAPAPAKASLQSIADTLNRLTLTVDGMGQSIERMDWTLQRQHHDMTAYFRGINYVPPPFDSTIKLLPPPGLKVTNNVLGDVLDPAFVIPKVNCCIMLPDVRADDAWCYPFKVPSKRVIVASQVPFEEMLLEGDVIFENWLI
ncbi:unnamed protein product [Cuscuta campestris]|uniref:Uncharacterized protein n=1 Tax=Cuscuta campestris TaxID=132261 RepID=A0A484LA17_9ASTE|nr:unnamed protein product [Cuscuta campestris]